MKREGTDEEPCMQNIENGGTDQEDESKKCRMIPSNNAHHGMASGNSQTLSVDQAPNLLQSIQPPAQAHEIMPQLSSAMPFMFATQQNIADLTGIKIEPLANDTSSILSAADTTGMSNSIVSTPFASTNPAGNETSVFSQSYHISGWVSWYGNYSNTNFGFPNYAPYSSGTGAVNAPYESFAPNYYMHRADLTKFQ